MIDWQTLLQSATGALAGTLFGAGVVYGAIKARLTAVEKSADHAHVRIDRLLLQRSHRS